MADNLSAGIPTYDFATQTQNNSISPVAVPRNPALDSAIVAEDIQKRNQPNKIDLSSSPYGSNTIDRLWAPTVDNRPSLERWNTNLDEAYVQLNNGTYKPRFENYMSGVDNENRLALQQGFWEKSLNGVGKFVSKTGLNVLDATIGTVNGLAEGITKGSFNAIYNNDFSKWIDDLNTKLDYNLPNYYSQQEKNNSLGANLLTTNFWADKFLGGMSFVTGTVISEGLWAAATGGGSLATIGARGALTEGAALLRNQNRVMHSITSLMNSYQRTVPVSRALQAFNNARFLYTSAGYEAGVEARHYMKEAEVNFNAYYQTQYGRKPTPEERVDFQNNLESGANGVFAANVALVGSSNILMFGDTFGVGSFLSNRGLQRGFNRSLGIGVERVAGEGVVDTYRALNPTRTQRILGNTHNILKSPFREGFVEEGGQYALGKFGQRWIESKYDANAMQDNFSVIDAMGKSLAETYGTKAGQEEVLLGALIGGAVSIRSGVLGSYSRDVAQQGRLAEARTANSDYNLLEKFTAANSQKAAREKLARTTDSGVIANQELNLALFSKLHVDNQMGLLDDSVSNLSASLNEMNDTELAQQLNVSVEQAQQAKSDAIQAHTQAVTDYKEAQSIAEAILPTNEGMYIEQQEGNTFIPNADLQSVFALNIYMGRNSERLAKGYANAISETIGDKGAASAVELEHTLQEKEINKSKEVRKLSRELQAINQAVTSRNEELIKIAAQPRTEKGDARLAQFETRRQQLLAAEERDQQRKAEIESELGQIATDVNNLRKARRIANQDFRAVFDQEDVTEDDLLKTVESINSLNETLDAWRNNGQESAANDVSYLIREFNNAQRAYRYANEAYNRIANPAFRKAEAKSIFGGFLKKAKKQGADISDYQKAKLDLFNLLKAQYIEFQALKPVGGATITEESTESVQTEEGDSLPTIPQTEQLQEQEDFEQRREEIINKPDYQRTVERLAEDYYLLTHITSEEDAVSIFNSNLQYSLGNGLSSTTTLLGAKGVTEQLSKILAGQSPVKGQNGMVIFGIPKSFFNQEKVTSEDIENYIIENYPEAIGSNLSIPQEFNIAYFTDGQLSLSDSVLEQQTPTVEQELQALDEQETELLQNTQIVEQAQEPTTLRDFYQGVVNRILQGRRDTDFANNAVKPTQSQIEEYKKLYERNRKSANGLKINDQIRFEELKNILNNYGRAIGTVDGGIKLADVLEQISNLDGIETLLDATPTVNNTNTEEVQAELSKVGIRSNNLSKTQYYEKSEFRVLEDGRFSITGINLEGLTEVIGKDHNVQVLYDKRKGQKNNRKQVDKPLVGENYEIGDKFIVQFDDVEIGVTIGATKGLEITPASVALLNEKTRLKLLPSTTLGTNYQPLLIELNRNAEVTPIEILNSNFAELEPGLSFTDVTNLPDNTEMTLQVSLRNEFNKNLIQRYRDGKAKLSELQNNLVIYVASQNGDVGGILKAIPQQISEDSNLESLLQIRNVAAQRAIASRLENEIIDTQITVPVDRGTSYFGKPNFNLVLNKATNTLYTELLPISDRALEKIADVGYITNGRLTLRENKREESNIDTTFVKKLSKNRKIPVIVFNYNGSRVAYPVSMNEIAVDKVAQFNEILNNGLPINERVKALNNYLAENNIDSNSIENGFYYIAGDTNIDDLDHINRLRDILASQSTYNDFTEWVNAPNIETAKAIMQQQASINIDITDKPFHSPKLALKLSERTIIGSVTNPTITIVETMESEEVEKEIQDNTCN